MKVVEGNFRDKVEEDSPTLSESMDEILTITELKDVKEAKFMYVVDTDERMSFMTNQHDPAQALFMLEQIKYAIITGGIDRVE